MNKSSFFLLVCTTLLFSIGLLMVFDTTSAEVLDRNLKINTHYAAIKQVICACFSVGLALFVSSVGYQKILDHIPVVFFACIVCLVGVFIKGIGQQVNGASRWIAIGPFSFQPSELMKLIMPLMFVHIYFKHREMTWQLFYKIIALFCVPLALILLEPDNGTVAILLMTMTSLFFLCRIRWVYWLLPALMLGVLGIFCAFRMPYVKKRLHVYMDPELDLLGKGHQPYQAKIAAGSGGLFGKGLGQSMQKLNYLPTARSDYIAAIYAEEFGFLGILFLVLLYMVIAYCGFCNAFLARDRKGFIIAAVMTFLLSLQAFLNLGVVSGLLPSKGTNLPFFSQGGSSLIANILALTLTIDVTKKTKRKRDKASLCEKPIQG